MAGRGVDILLGGNPSGLASEILHRKGLNPADVDEATSEAALDEAKRITAEDHDKVVAAGGLHIIGTERHDARRIDNQLRGRAGRQGDPGSSRFFLSLDDELMKRFASDRVAGLMQRFGIEEDVPIESGLVSKTIEGAQSRVEGFNFDMRKRVVELDDVINKQRETVYRERDKILRNEDLTETVRAFLDAEVDELIAANTTGEPEEWTLDTLSKALAALGLPESEVSEARLVELRTPDAMREAMADVVDREIERREQEVGADDWAMVERLILLRTVDQVWVEHLTELDDLRRGIYLRGYAQTDPIAAFKKEARGLYEEFQGLIRHQVAITILRVSIVRQPTQPQPMTMRPLVATGADGDGQGTQGNGRGEGRQGGAVAAAAAIPASPMASIAGQARGGPAPAAGPGGLKLGRNDPCWCGSGKKYKRCHGA
jgi:preprotein translocase subunit SecA